MIEPSGDWVWGFFWLESTSTTKLGFCKLLGTFHRHANLLSSVRDSAIFGHYRGWPRTKASHSHLDPTAGTRSLHSSRAHRWTKRGNVTLTQNSSMLFRASFKTKPATKWAPCCVLAYRLNTPGTTRVFLAAKSDPATCAPCTLKPAVRNRMDWSLCHSGRCTFRFWMLLQTLLNYKQSLCSDTLLPTLCQ